MLSWGGEGSLRVDVSYKMNHRHYYVERETKPNIKRLLEKGHRRKKCRKRINYPLVFPESEYGRHEWSKLRGCFDRVFAYRFEDDRFTEALDLRTFGGLQDLVLDLMTPPYMSPESQRLCRHLWRNKNYVVAHLNKLG